MVKAIFSNPIGRKIVATTMFTTAIVSTNATNLKTINSNDIDNHTEIISKSASSALRNNIITFSTKNQEHNKKIEKNLAKICNSNKEIKRLKESTTAIYKTFGTFGGTIELQRIIDDYYIENTFDKYKEHYSMNEKKIEYADQIFSHFLGWKDNVYYTELFSEELKLYETTDFPAAEVFFNVIDNHVNNKNFFLEEDAVIYKKLSDNFKSKQKETFSLQAKSDLIAYKIHLLNTLAFYNYFEQVKDLPDKYIFKTNFRYDFVNKGVITP